MYYKFIHIFTVKRSKFNKILVDLALENNEIFQLNNTLFVTYDKSFYELYKNRCNIIYCKCNKYTSVKMINKYGDCGEWLFVHNLPMILAQFINKKYYKKILWRTWGDDLTFSNLDDYDLLKHMQKYDKKNYLLYFFVNIYVRIFNIEEKTRKIVKQFHSIGISNIVDKININKFYGNVNIVEMHYSTKNEHQVLLSEKSNTYNDGYLHVMIDHSGFDYGQIEVVKLLKQYENEKIYLHFPLNYGPKKWINKIIEFVNENWNGKKEIILEHIPYEQYASLLNKMDIIILSSNKSTALGNLYMGLFFEKTIYLSRKGVLSEGLKLEKVPFYYIDDIKNLSFIEFSHLLKYQLSNNSSLFHKPHSVNVDLWKAIFDNLE